MNIYVTRHGETEWNTVGRMQGWGNSSLTKLGEKQAKALSNRFKDIDLDVIYCSILERACNTAQIIKGDKNIEIIKLDALKEMGLGDWEGKTLEEISGDEAYKIQLNYLFNEPFKYKPFGGETISEMYERVSKTLDYIIKNANPYANILIVTHGMTIQGIMNYFSKKINVDIDNEVYKQTSLTHIKIDNDSYEMILKNDTSHYSYIKL